MFNTIVWATDGSEDAIRALPYAKALATGEKALLVVVHIVHEPGSADAERGSAVDGGQVGGLPGERARAAWGPFAAGSERDPQGS